MCSSVQAPCLQLAFGVEVRRWITEHIYVLVPTLGLTCDEM